MFLTLLLYTTCSCAPVHAAGFHFHRYIGRNFCSYKIYHFFYFLERLLKFWGRPQTFWEGPQSLNSHTEFGDVPKIFCYLPQNGKSVKNKNFGELLGDINRGFFWHLGTFWGSDVSCGARKNAERQKIPINTKIACLAVLDYGASFLCATKKSIKYFRF